jgi:hypothetical protein
MRSLTVSIVVVVLLTGCGGAGAAPLKEVGRVRSGQLDVVLLSAADTLKQGKGTFVVEFRDGSGGLVDVGTVMVSASMAMPGMAPMFGESVVMPGSPKGRYEVSSDLGMGGAWRFDIAWSGPRGEGQASVRATAS